MVSVICQPSQTGGGGLDKSHAGRYESYEWLSRDSPQPEQIEEKQGCEAEGEEEQGQN